MGTDFPHTSQVEGDSLAFEGANSWFVQGNSPSIKALERVICELADSDVPVLLLAEAGAGKRATAKRIHQLSARRASQFIAANAGALTSQGLLASAASGDLFDGGTLFLE